MDDTARASPHINTPACGGDDAPHPVPVSGTGHFRQALQGHFCQAPKKKWLLLSRWKNLAKNQRGLLNSVFHLNRRVFKAYLLKESLEKLWDYRYEGAMLNYLQKWMDQLHRDWEYGIY